MEKLDHPKFNVAAQWLHSSGIMCVQVVEIAENKLQQLLGGTYAIRVCMLNGDGDAGMAFTVKPQMAKELCELIDTATASLATSNLGRKE